MLSINFISIWSLESIAAVHVAPQEVQWVHHLPNWALQWEGSVRPGARWISPTSKGGWEAEDEECSTLCVRVGHHEQDEVNRALHRQLFFCAFCFVCCLFYSTVWIWHRPSQNSSADITVGFLQFRNCFTLRLAKAYLAAKSWCGEPVRVHRVL